MWSIALRVQSGVLVDWPGRRPPPSGERVRRRASTARCMLRALSVFRSTTSAPRRDGQQHEGLANPHPTLFSHGCSARLRAKPGERVARGASLRPRRRRARVGSDTLSLDGGGGAVGAAVGCGLPRRASARRFAVGRGRDRRRGADLASRAASSSACCAPTAASVSLRSVRRSTR